MNPPGKYPTLKELIDLSGKNALVSGGAMGIGYAIADRLSEAGAAVAIIDLNEEKGQSVARSLLELGRKACFIRCDVSLEEEVVSAFNSALDLLGGIDILINNAGIFPSTPLFQITEVDVDRVLSVNVKAVLTFCREFSRWAAEKKRGGCIINLASIDSVHPSHKGLSIYDASKGAVLTLTKSLAKELAASGIRVNAIAPGGILTEGVLARRDPESTRSGLREFMSRIPLGRMGVADDVGRVALFLSSDLSSYMTGELVVVDGGYLVS
jgi:2-dehydro-3-deoxy-D-gluconate 5-dehydrogenase